MKRIAYLVNQYPKVSHSFIRREILALERQGLEVERYSIRSLEAELVDPSDIEENAKTRFVLPQGMKTILLTGVLFLLKNPMAFLNGLKLAMKMGYKSERGLLLHVIYLLEACTLVGWFKEDRIDHIHAHFGTNSTTVAMLCTALGGPSYSFTVHGPEEFDKACILGLTEKINRAIFVAAVSSYGKSQLFRLCDYSQWHKIKVIHCGVDSSFIEKALKPAPQNRQLVCVGRLSEQKGHFLLLSAAKKLLDDGVEFKLVLVGDGELRSEVESFITQNGLQSTIEITGWCSNSAVLAHLESSRALVLPSFAEGLPVAIMESLALGRPVITTYIAGIPELVKDNINGWLIPAGDIDTLATAMGLALDCSEDKLNEMGQAGHEAVAAEHDINKEAAKLASLFNDLT